MLNPYAKAALFVIRLAACGLIVLGFGLCAGDLFLWLARRPFSGPGLLALKASPVPAGAALYWKAKAIAIRLTKDLE
jgi:hypothetical protein